MFIQVLKNPAKYWSQITIFFSVGILTLNLFHPSVVAAPENYPRLANYFLRVPIRMEEVPQLAKYDILILGMQAQTESPEALKALRVANPKIILLAYTASQEVPLARLSEIEKPGGLWHQLVAGIDESWYLKDSRGGYVSTWPGSRSLNVTNFAPVINGERWNTYLPKFMAQKVFSSGLWDGIFYDNVWDNASWMNDGNNDTNNDGRKDDKSFIDTAWNQGMVNMLLTTRQVLDPKLIIMGNGGQSYIPYMNGRLFEGFGFSWDGGWSGSVDKYKKFVAGSQKPQTTSLIFNTDNTGIFNNYSQVRFGLGTTLLSDGYFGYDYGTNDHSQILWYDEYSANLGRPLGPARLTSNGKISDSIVPEMYRREFERGVVFVNGSDFRRRVLLGGELEALKGNQDPKVNNGQIVSTVELAGRTAQIFLRPLDSVKNISYPAGAFVRVVSPVDGTKKRNGFFTTNVLADNGAETLELTGGGLGGTSALTVKESKVWLYREDGTLITTIKPFGGRYTGDIRLQVADLEGQGFRSLILSGRGTRTFTPIEIYNFRGVLRQKLSLPFDGRTSAPRIAIIPGSNQAATRIVLASAAQVPASLGVFDLKGKLKKQWQPYGFATASLAVAAIPATNSSSASIAVSPVQSQGKTQVRYYALDGTLQKTLDITPESLSALSLGYGDIDSDSQAELVVFSTSLAH